MKNKSKKNNNLQLLPPLKTKLRLVPHRKNLPKQQMKLKLMNEIKSKYVAVFTS